MKPTKGASACVPGAGTLGGRGLGAGVGLGTRGLGALEPFSVIGAVAAAPRRRFGETAAVRRLAPVQGRCGTSAPPAGQSRSQFLRPLPRVETLRTEDLEVIAPTGPPPGLRMGVGTRWPSTGLAMTLADSLGRKLPLDCAADRHTQGLPRTYPPDLA